MIEVDANTGRFAGIVKDFSDSGGGYRLSLYTDQARDLITCLENLIDDQRNLTAHLINPPEGDGWAIAVRLKDGKDLVCGTLSPDEIYPLFEELDDDSTMNPKYIEACRKIAEMCYARLLAHGFKSGGDIGAAIRTAMSPGPGGDHPAYFWSVRSTRVDEPRLDF